MTNKIVTPRALQSMMGPIIDRIEIKENNDDFTEQMVKKPKAILFSEPTTSSETKMILRQG